jgi:hypothetical protein
MQSCVSNGNLQSSSSKTPGRAAITSRHKPPVDMHDVCADRSDWYIPHLIRDVLYCILIGHVIAFATSTACLGMAEAAQLFAYVTVVGR